ncbi:unnamed protein product [Closterium sp. Naga37s-1]|nr:unnamed protein product [Closterium sp. Naga37s-1]
MYLKHCVGRDSGGLRGTDFEGPAASGDGLGGGQGEGGDGAVAVAVSVTAGNEEALEERILGGRPRLGMGLGEGTEREGMVLVPWRKRVVQVEGMITRWFSGWE